MNKEDVSYRVERRDIKHPRLEIKTGNLVVVAPKDSTFDVPAFVERHMSWVKEKMDFIKKIKLKFKGLTLEKKSTDKLKQISCDFIEVNKEKLKVKPNRVAFREMKTKWGSCSHKRNLTLNKLLRFLPEDMIGYVVYHEMCHLKVLKHNEEFWSHIKKEYPNHEEYEERLFGYWFLIED